jgi:hypothetical protein
MGQDQLRDVFAVRCLSKALAGLGENLAPQAEVSLPREERIEGRGFLATLRLIPDYERGDGSLCVDVRLVRKGPGRHRERFLYLRHDQATRRLEYPRTWRSLGGSHLRRSHRRKLTFMELSRDIYWNPKAPSADLRAQVVIVLDQFGLISRRASLRWLNTYLGQFRVPLGTVGSSANARENVRKSIRWSTAAHLLDQWCYPEDGRAFRRYVTNRIRLETRAYNHTSSTFSLDNESLNRLRQAEDSPLQKTHSYRSSDDLAQTIGTGNAVRVSVSRAAEILGWTRAYLYRLIHQGKVNVTSGKPQSITSDEIRRLAEIRILKERRGAEEKALQESGKTPEAARKAIYRKYGRCPGLKS